MKYAHFLVLICSSSVLGLQPGAGVPAQWDHPLIDETRRRVAKVARKHNKFAGTVGNPVILINWLKWDITLSAWVRM